MTEAWNIFDSQGRGYLDAHEVKALLRALGFPISSDETRSIMQRYGRDEGEDGQRILGFEDYVDVITAQYAARDPAEELRQAFELFDEDSSGLITLRVCA